MLSENEQTFPLLTEETFPSLSDAFVPVKTKKNVHNPAEDSSATSTPVAATTPSVKEENKDATKYFICNTVLAGSECPYGNKCKYAHYEDEWAIQECAHGSRCNRVKGNQCKNVDPKNICLYLHPQEDMAMFYKRLKVSKSKITRPSKEEIAKTKHFTKMCDSYFLGVPCNKPSGECTYAHDKDQLIVKDCNFGDKCNHVTRHEDSYVTVGDIICMFRHWDETFDNYNDRVLEARKVLVLKQQADNKEKKKVEKPKVSIPPPVQRPTTMVWGDVGEEPVNEPVNKPVKEDQDDKILIEVPESMVMDILKVMIASGKTHFELKIKK
jgi:hypothetical protein